MADATRSPEKMSRSSIEDIVIGSLVFWRVNLRMRNGAPMMMPILATLDPMMFPNAKSTAPLLDDITVMTSSGTDVVKASKRNPTFVSERPVSSETLVALPIVT